MSSVFRAGALHILHLWNSSKPKTCSGLYLSTSENQCVERDDSYIRES